jgi:hypothetical protein
VVCLFSLLLSFWQSLFGFGITSYS